MKQIKKYAMLAVAVIVLAFASAVQANSVTILQGGSTNQFVLTGSTTNIVGVFAGLSTNAFNLGYGVGVQGNTNLWPSAGDALVGYPGTLAGPSRVVTPIVSGSLTTGTGTVPISFSLSNDGTIWVTNAFTFTWTPGSPGLTNFDTQGANYICVNQLVNTNAGAVTNLVISLGQKPSL
jgi:hypothetical protein